MRLVLRGALVLVVCVAVVAAADAAAFEMRARSLERAWRADLAAGVPASTIAAQRAQLETLRARRVAGLLPYEAASGALLVDPLAGLESSTRGAEKEALLSDRQRARAALAELQRLGGPNYYPDYYQHLAELARARHPAEYARLTARWQAEARELSELRSRLGTASGGLSQEGLPADVASQVALLHSLAEQAARAGLETGPAVAAEADGQIYLGGQYADQARSHDQAVAELGGALTVLQKRLNDWEAVHQALDQAQKLIPQLQGSGGDFSARLRQLRASLSPPPDDAHLASALQSARQLVEDVRNAVDAQPPASDQADLGACIQGAPAQLIVIHLATQQLVAYTNGCPWLHTPVTTGRPALPTARGSFQIFAKYPAYKMVSPWPRGSPYWYPTAWVYNAMEFVGDGTFLHSANWEPGYAYGPGSQYGPYSSHGCVHVMDGPLSQLYGWAALGTTVTVED